VSSSSSGPNIITFDDEDVPSHKKELHLESYLNELLLISRPRLSLALSLEVQKVKILVSSSETFPFDLV